MLHKRVLAVSCVLGLAMVLIAVVNRGMAQEEESSVKKLMLADFETPERSAGLPQSDSYVKEGEYSGKWDNFPEHKKVYVFRGGNRDFSEYNVFSFWIYSEEANNQKIYLFCYSDNEETEGRDYYNYRIKVNWTGWKRFLIPFNRFRKNRDPLDWDHIGPVFFSGRWHPEEELKPDTVLYLDKIELISIPESVDI